MYTHAKITRTLTAVPGSTALSMAQSLMHDVPVGDTVHGPVRTVMGLIAAHQRNDRYACLPDLGSRGYNNRDLVLTLNDLCTRADTVSEDIVVDFWQFDYGDIVHAHVGVYKARAYNRVIAVNNTAFPDLVGITTRPDNPRLHGDGMFGDVEPALSYIFGDDTTSVPSAKTIDPNHVFAWCAVDTISGPDLADPVWDTDPKPPGHDLVYDITSGGSHAVRGVYHIAK